MALPVSILSSMAIQGLLTDLAAGFERVSAHRVVSESVGGVEDRQARAGRRSVRRDRARGQRNRPVDRGGQDRRGQPRRSGDVGRRGRGAGGRRAVDLGPARRSGRRCCRRAVSATRPGPAACSWRSCSGSGASSSRSRSGSSSRRRVFPVGTLVAAGEVELGFQQLSELIHVPGIDVLGPLPADIQIITTFSAVVGDLDAGRRGAGDVRFHDVARRRRGQAPARHDPVWRRLTQRAGDMT